MFLLHLADRNEHVKYSMKKLNLLLSFALFTSVLSAQTVLEYKLNPGDVFLIQQDAQQTITQELDGAAHQIENSIRGILEFKVVKELDDSYQVDMSFKDINLTMTSSIQGILMDVKAKDVIEGDMQSKIFNSLLDVPVQMKLAKTGDILEVTGGDSLVQKMADASGLTDEFQLNMMKKSLEKEFGSEALSNSYKQLTFIYPIDPIQKGDTWENEYVGKTNAKNNWTLEEVSADNATISGKADVILDLKEPATTMLLTGTQETTIRTDIASGFILEMKVEGVSTGTSSMTQMGLEEIPTSITSIITYKLIQ